MSMITWKGNLAVDARLEGFMGTARVASIRPDNGGLLVAYTRGLQPEVLPAASVKEAKLLGDESMRDFMLDIRVRRYTPDELVIVQAMLDNKGEGAEALWIRLAQLWTQQHFDNQRLIANIKARLAELQADLARSPENVTA